MDQHRGKFYERVARQVVEHARHEFELDRFVDGRTVREHLQIVERARPGSKKDELTNPMPMPAAAAYLWDWYMEVSHTGRIYHEGIALPLTSSEILAWATLRGLHLTPWEVRVIRLLDACETGVRNRRSETT